MTDQQHDPADAGAGGSSRGPSRKSFPLRIDPRLYQELKAWAEQEMRSVNGQIEFLLREAVRRRKNKP